jgi:hypothetical protein
MQALYVALNGEDRVAVYERSADDSTAGSPALTHRSDTRCPAPHHLAVDPGNRFLFAATTTHLRSFAIDPRTGGQLMQPWTLKLFSCHLVYFISDSPYKIY